MKHWKMGAYISHIQGHNKAVPVQYSLKAQNNKAVPGWISVFFDNPRDVFEIFLQCSFVDVGIVFQGSVEDRRFGRRNRAGRLVWGLPLWKTRLQGPSLEIDKNVREHEAATGHSDYPHTSSELGNHANSKHSVCLVAVSNSGVARTCSASHDQLPLAITRAMCDEILGRVQKASSMCWEMAHPAADTARAHLTKNVHQRVQGC